MSEEAKKQHRLLINIVNDNLLEKDFIKLMNYCKVWIAPATLQNIKTTYDLLDQLEKQDVIRVGHYEELTTMLKEHNLHELNNMVEEQANRVEIPVELDREDTRVKELADGTPRSHADGMDSGPRGTPVPAQGSASSTPSTPAVDKVEKLTHVTITMGISSGETEKLTISPGPNQGNPMVCDVLVSWRIRKLKLVFDGLAICSGVTAKSRGRKSKGGAVEHAMREITPRLLGPGVSVQYGDKSWTT